MLEYTNINHQFRKHCGISTNEYVLCDMVYHLSVNPKAPVSGWCSMTKEHLAEEIGLSKQAVISMIDRMVTAGFLVKNEVTKHLQTTEKWYEGYFTNGKETLPRTVKKLYQTQSRNFTEDGKETLPYINKDINTDIHIDKKGEYDYSLFPQLEDDEVEFENSLVANESVFQKKLAEEQKLGVDVMAYYHSVKDWSTSLPKRDKRKKKTAKGWIATARQFMRSDKEKGKLKLVTTIEKKEALREAELNYLNSNI